jgi:glutathione S-transferase
MCRLHHQENDMKLYFNPKSRAVNSKWLLDEIGADYDLVHIDMENGEHKSEDFRQINPAGKLPALVDGDDRVFESVAISLYLVDTFPDANLGPQPGDPGRGRFLSLMVYATSQFEPAMGDKLMDVDEGSASRGWTDFDTCLDVVEQELGDGPWLFGDWFTAADLMIGATLFWKRMFDGPTDRQALEDYTDRLLARPSAPSMGG